MTDPSVYEHTNPMRVPQDVGRVFSLCGSSGSRPTDLLGGGVKRSWWDSTIAAPETRLHSMWYSS